MWLSVRRSSLGRDGAVGLRLLGVHDLWQDLGWCAVSGLTSEERLRDLLGRIGFGDGVTEPMADNDTVVEFIEAAVMDQSEHRECPIVCELCGERLADKPCSHCGGCGANVALSTASLAYAECEWCAGAGKVHEGCKELTYAELAARLADAEARAEAAEAERDSAKTANTAVWVMADRASRKGYELDPDDVLEALRGDQ